MNFSLLLHRKPTCLGCIHPSYTWTDWLYTDWSCFPSPKLLVLVFFWNFSEKKTERNGTETNSTLPWAWHLGMSQYSISIGDTKHHGLDSPCGLRQWLCFKPKMDEFLEWQFRYNVINDLLEPADRENVVPPRRALSKWATAALEDVARTCLIRGSLHGKQGNPVLLMLAEPW